jgi:period circadian protein
MEFYHPEDMSVLKEVYETIMIKGRTAGASFCGKPYRFLTHNRCYITIETEWSTFVNPWSHHLEFVIGYHRVLKGPVNPNVLASHTNAQETQAQISESVINESKMIREEILKLLTEPVTRPSDTVKQQVSKRCQALASFMETLMDEVTKSGSRADLKLDLPQESDLTFSERDSVMLIGEISPHHDYFDSKSSSETPPSYNQLNYNENLQRFFDSRPVTVTVAGPDTMKMDQTDTEADTRANLSPMQCFGESGGSESAGNLSSASNAHMESITNTSTGTSNGSYIPPTLTEALLCKHNEDMEKMIIKRHKVARVNKAGEKGKKSQEQSHGVKRSGSHSWEGGEIYKTSKQQHVAENKNSTITQLPYQNQSNQQLYQNANVDLWPPFSVSSTAIQNTHTTAHATHFATSSIFPTVYYIPQNVAPQEQQQPGQLPIANVQYMPGVFYQQMVYPHPSTFYQMQFQPTSTHSGFNDSIYNSAFQLDKSNMAMPIMQKIPTPIGSGSQNQSTTFQRPPSQATSVKADMGSTSASVVNRVRIMKIIKKEESFLLNCRVAQTIVCTVNNFFYFTHNL